MNKQGYLYEDLRVTLRHLKSMCSISRRNFKISVVVWNIFVQMNAFWLQISVKTIAANIVKKYNPTILEDHANKFHFTLLWSIFLTMTLQDAIKSINFAAFPHRTTTNLQQFGVT